MLIRLTAHAVFRLQERGFSIDDIKNVIKSSRKAKNLGDGMYSVTGKVMNTDKGVLTVVYRKQVLNNKKVYHLIITAYFTK